MCYDDHQYCTRCKKHSRQCYCFTYSPPDAEDEAGGRMCQGGDGHN